jgi:transposase
MGTEDFNFTEQERFILLEAHRACIGKREADRIKAIILLAKGWALQQVEEALLLDERTILRYKKIYKEEGIDALISNSYQGGFFKLSAEQLAKLKVVLDTHLFGSAAEVCEYVKNEFKITYTPEGMVQTLHRLGYSYKKTKVVPGKVDLEKQKEFVRQYSEIKETLEKDEKIYFSDAVHPTHNMMPAYAWIKKGEERSVKSNTGRKRINLLGFYSPNDQEVVIDSFETINAKAVIQMFKKLESKHPELKKIIIFMDNARYNYCHLVWDYLKTSRIQIIYLPAYSPNLNLIERLWKLLKKRVMYNKYYERFEDFHNALLNFFKKRSKNFKNELRTLLAENFHLFGSPSG